MQLLAALRLAGFGAALKRELQVSETTSCMLLWLCTDITRALSLYELVTMNTVPAIVNEHSAWTPGPAPHTVILQ